MTALGLGRRKLLWGMALALAGGGVIASPRPAAAEEAAQILIRSLSADATFVGEQVTEVVGAPKPKRAQQQRQQVFRKGSILRINYPNGQVMFDDGVTMQLLLPRQGFVERGPSPRNAASVLKQRRALLKGRAPLTALPDDQVAGRATFVVVANPPNGTVRKVWVDKQTYVQLRQDVTQPNGRTISTYFTRINFGQEPPAEMMTFVPPPGAQIVEAGQGRPLPPAMALRLARERWGNLLEPKTIPAGYRFRAFYRHNFRGQPFIVSVYEGPNNNTVSFFQGPALGMGQMNQKEKGVRVVTGRKGNAEVMVVGPLPQEDLQRMMDSAE